MIYDSKREYEYFPFSLSMPQLKLLQIPLGKVGETEDIPEMATFLASEWSRYCNYTTNTNIDGSSEEKNCVHEQFLW